MKNLPIFVKIILNIILYLVYVVIFWFLFWLLFPIILELLNKPILNPNDPVFDKIAIILAFLVLLVTIFLRKYFYISFSWNIVDKKRIEEIKENKKEEKLDKEYEKNVEENNDDLEIFVWKEK